MQSDYKGEKMETLALQKTAHSLPASVGRGCCVRPFFLIVYEKIKMQINSQMVIDICKSVDIYYTLNGRKIISFENINGRLKISIMYILQAK